MILTFWLFLTLVFISKSFTFHVALCFFRGSDTTSRHFEGPWSRAVMSIGNQKFGIPRKYQYQIGIWYFCSKFLGIFLVFYRYFEEALVKIWLNIGIFGRIKIGLVFGFCSCHFIGIGLVSVSNFSENGTSSPEPLPSQDPHMDRSWDLLRPPSTRCAWAHSALNHRRN